MPRPCLRAAGGSTARGWDRDLASPGSPPGCLCARSPRGLLMAQPSCSLAPEAQETRLWMAAVTQPSSERAQLLSG